MFKRILGPPEPSVAAGVAYGVPIRLEAPDKALLKRIRTALPAAWVESKELEISAPELRFALKRDTEQGYSVTLNDAVLLLDPLDQIMELLPSLIRQYLAAEAREFIFVHAGAVAFNGRGIVIPGNSFSGKTTLVGALARAGALYYSDEYAVITPDGLLIPYPKDLSLRLVEGERAQTDRSIAEIGGVPGVEPVQVSLLVLTEYRSTASWHPVEQSAAQGVIATLGHTEPVQERPQTAVPAITRALANARILKGLRGDADETAAALLAMLA